MHSHIDTVRTTAVVVTYNEERYIQACLESLFDNDYPLSQFEVIVVDGGSTDRTIPLVEEYCRRLPNVILLSNPRRTAGMSFYRYRLDPGECDVVDGNVDPDICARSIAPTADQ